MTEHLPEKKDNYLVELIFFVFTITLITLLAIKCVSLQEQLDSQKETLKATVGLVSQILLEVTK